jgi:hypothetical protein
MSFLLVLAVFMFILAGCVEKETADNAKPFTDKAVVLQTLDDYVAAWNSGDKAAVLALLVPDGKYRYGWPAVTVDKAGYAKVVGDSMVKEPVLSFKYKSVTPDDDEVKVKLVGSYSSGPSNETYYLVLVDGQYKIKSWNY